MISIYVHGRLGRLFVDKIKLHVHTPNEAVRALIILYPGFREELSKMNVAVMIGRKSTVYQRWWMPIYPGQELHIVPVPSGSNRGGIGKVVLGAVIIGAAIAFAPAAGLGATAFSVLGAGVSFGQIALLGATIALAGISSLLTPTPTVPGTSSRERPDQRPSFLFNGPVNTAEQGAAIPIVFGEYEIGSHVISSALRAVDLPIDDGPGTPTGPPQSGFVYDRSPRYRWETSPPSGQDEASFTIWWAGDQIVRFEGMNADNMTEWQGGPFVYNRGPFEEAISGGLGYQISRTAVDDIPSGSKGGGKGGGDSGSSRTPQEAPNSLRSKSVAYVLDAVCEGPVVGLNDGLASVKIDDVPVRVGTSFNFDGVTLQDRPGTPDQTPVDGFPASSREVISGVQVVQDTPIEFAITDTNVTSLEIKVRLPSLSRQDPETGDILGTEVEYVIEASQDAATWSIRERSTISGKQVGPYEQSKLIRRPTGFTTPWFARVRRITEDSDSAILRNDLFLSTYTEIIDSAFRYPDTAYFALVVDAEGFVSSGVQSIPARSYTGRWLVVDIPSNYNPITRVYTGIWDGTFIRAWTDNPAWVMYAALTNERWGLGRFVTEAMVDKFTLYEISQYNDELVPDGAGGFEPRYTFNGGFFTQETAARIIAAIAASMFTTVYWTGGQVTFSQDRPRDAVKLITPSNVIDGEFTYSTPALSGRHSAVQVSWNDPNDGYRPAVEVVEDQALINRIRYRPFETAAIGCTSRGRARRFGRQILATESLEGKTATWRASLDQADLRPGDVVQVADPNVSGAELGGRIVAGTLSEITIDRDFTPVPTVVYTVTVVLPNGTLSEHTVTGTSGTGNRVLAISPNLSAVPVDLAVWVLSSNQAEPVPYRIVKIAETEPFVFEISAIRYAEEKFAQIELGAEFDGPDFTLIPTGPLSNISEIVFEETLYRQAQETRVRLSLSWDLVQIDPRVSAYEIQYVLPGETQLTALEFQRTTALELENIAAGPYTFRIRPVTPFGLKGAWQQQSYLVIGLGAPISDVQDFRLDVQSTSVHLSWAQVEDLNLSHYEIRRSPSITNVSWGASETVISRVAATATSVTISAFNNSTYLIKAISLAGNESLNAAAVTVSSLDLIPYNVIISQDEHPTFPGVKTNMEVVGGSLQLAATATMADWVSLALVPTLLYAGTGVQQSGTYDFSEFMDFGAVFDNIRIEFRYVATFSNIRSRIMLWERLSDVVTLSGADGDDASFNFLVSTTEDDPTDPGAVFTPFQRTSVSSYRARAFRFRLAAESRTPFVTPVFSEISVIADLPDRIISEEDLNCPAAGLQITFPNGPFRIIRPFIAVDAQELNTGDYYNITNITSTGFFLRFFDSTNAGVARTFDYLAKGF